MQRNDLLWKGVIESLIEDFLLFFYPEEVELFDFSKGFVFLDQELAQLFPESKNSTRYIDKLIQVHLRGGGNKWILIHVEVQGYVDKNFAERMYIYHYRIRERFQRDIGALAIFTDNNLHFRPDTFKREFLGTTLIYRFRTYKVLAQQEKDLLVSANPFALVVLATLTALKKGKMDDAGLWNVKHNLVRLLYERKYDKERISTLFSFINHYIRFSDSEKVLIFAKEMVSEFEPNTKNMGIHEMLIQEATEKSLKKGIEKGIEKVVLTAHKKGVAVEFIAEIVGLPIEKVKEIIRLNTK